MIHNSLRLKRICKDKKIEIRKEEYKTLREEILRRLDYQYRLIHFSILLFSSFLALVALVSEIRFIELSISGYFIFLLIVPIPFYLIILSYQEQNYFISSIGYYINNELEPKISMFTNQKLLGWEDFIASRRKFLHDFLTGSKFLFLNLFALTPLILAAYIINQEIFTFRIIHYILLIINLLFLLGSIYSRHKTIEIFKSI